MAARHYSPELGRFVQPDPDRSEANLYAYAANNPVTEMDPDGTCFIVCAVANALLDTAIYFATTDSSEWSVQGAAGAAAVGAVTGFLGVGLLSKVGKIGAVAKVVNKVLTKVPKARQFMRVVKRVDQRGMHGVAGVAARTAFKYPKVLKYVSPKIGRDIGRRAGLQVGVLRRGTGRGGGVKLLERGRTGAFTGRQLRWHPGGGHHGPQPYWRVAGPNRETVRIFQ